MADGTVPTKRLRFKPANAARAKDYVTKPIPHANAAMFIREHHYAHGCANTSTEAFGLFRGRDLVGAALWMPPTKPAAQSVDPFDWRRVINLSRLAIAPSEPQNAASLFIGAMLRTLFAERKWTMLLTYADMSQGHEGTIYKATNWRYLGRTKPEARWLDANGKQVSKLATKSRRADAMRGLGHRMVGKYRKHKFATITPIGVAQSLIRWAEAIRCTTHARGKDEQ
jgi:hypothetical protein